MNTALEGREYLCGALTVADLAVATWADFGIQAGLSFDDFPHAKAWFERMSARESMQKSAPQR